MLSLDILICTVNTRIVRIPDMLMPPQEGITYIVSFQYTKDDYLALIPQILLERSDVVFVKMRGEGLSANRNHALSYAQSDLIYLIDDDSRFLSNTIADICETFEQHPDIDIALFQAQTYTGQPLRPYGAEQRCIASFTEISPILTNEMVCRRSRIQGSLTFDARFGLSSHFLSCYEQQVFLIDACHKGLRIQFFPKDIIQTSAIFQPRLLYVDQKVQRSYGALLYYAYGLPAMAHAFVFALRNALRGKSRFIPLIKHLMEGISYIRTTNKRLAAHR